MGAQQAAARVLIVEDDPDLSVVLGELLALERISCAVAKNGLEALALLAENPLPKLILLDLQMPAMDGAQFRQRQLENALWSKIPVIVLSADRRIAQVSTAMKVEGFLPKPIDIDSLLKLIGRWA